MSKITFNKNVDFIEGNPFFRRVEDSPSALWVLENEGRVKWKIKSTLQEFGQGEYDVDECYDYMIYYFIENTDKEFDPNYFNNQELMDKINGASTIDEIKRIEEKTSRSSNYTIDKYIMSRVRKETMGLIKEMEASKNMQRYAENIESEGTGYYNPNTISIDVASANKKKDYGNIEDSPEMIIDFMELQDMLENELHIYDDEFISRGLTKFRTRPFVECLFLADMDDEEEMAERLGLYLSTFQKYKNSFRIIVQGKSSMNEEFGDLKNTMSMLIRGKVSGWQPKLSI